MRKNQTLLVAGILLLASTAVAQAQGVYEVFSNPLIARSGGAREMAGDVVLFLRTGMHAGGVVTVTFSAPLAEGLAVDEGGVTVTDGTAVVDVDEGTIMITLPGTGEGSVTLSGVRLDVREAEAPVTAMFSGDSDAFLSGAANVISAINDALMVESTETALLTRGGMGTATVTITEAHASVFTDNSNVILRVSGVPDNVMLHVSHAGFDTDAEDAATQAAGVMGTVTLNTGTIIVDMDNIQDPAGPTGTLTVMGDDGKDIDITIGFDMPGGTGKESVELLLTLDASSSVEELMLPLDEGMVEVMATMAPTSKPATVELTTEYFTEKFLPAGGAVAFTFDPARCTLLYPYVTYNPPAMVDTGIAVTNPTGFGGDALSGPIKFSLYGNDSDPESYTTDAGTPGGMAGGLDENGNLAAGKTYSVLLSQLMSWLDIEGTFEGHVYVETDFTRCSGLGLVWDNNGTFSQGYIPELIADEVTAGERSRIR